MRNRKRFKGTMAVLTLMGTLAFRPVTALADSAFEGDIVIENAVADYEYKVYDVFDVTGLGGQGMIFSPGQGWEEFAQTDEESLAFMILNEEGNYIISPDATNDIASAFVESAMEYAEENEVPPTATMVAESGKVTFKQLPLGLYVIDMANGTSFTIMRDMEWVSTMKEKKPEQTAEPSPEAQEPETQEEPESKEEQASTESSTEESVADTEQDGNKQESVAATAPAETESTEEGGSNAVTIVVVVVVIVAVVAVALVLVKKRK